MSSSEAASRAAENGAQTNGTQINGVKDDTRRQNPRRRPQKANTFPLSFYRQESLRPLPTETGDGTYRAVTKRPTLVKDIRSIGWRDIMTVKQVIVSKLKGETQQDDKAMVMEKIIRMVATLPDRSYRQETLTNFFIDELWNSLDHPPLLYMGDEFRYRQPDGSNNNPLMPKLGAAHTPYSRTVKPGKANLGALPDPETVYESVMARGTFKKNPNNVSSILWYWATIIIHDLFNTNMRDANQNDSSSYLDLSPLYGSTKEAIDSVRTFRDGMLKPDTFADRRLLGNPPGVCVILIMFNRFHNHVARNLAEINEHNRFPRPAPNLSEADAAAGWKKYDEDLFQTARLITSGLYINITLIDYVRNIINLNRVDSTWTLDPRQEMGVSAGTSKGSESGVGNVVSAEFNLCYRWHSCISQMDEEWIQDFYRQLLGEDHDEIDLPTLIGAVKKFSMSMPPDPAHRTFNGFKRGLDGRFDDNELVDCIATAIEQPGGAFGAQNVPRIMKPVEILGILRGRKWNLAGLNEFRKHFGLKAYATFEDINSDPTVSSALRNLYQHPDHVELYPGIVAEEAKTPMVPGVGIAPTYTISRVVLSDAVALVRGDRYYTTDYHPGYLTQWGYNEVNYDFKINHGCVFYKLFNRAFPNHFRRDSVYAHYPMVIPSENRDILSNLGRDHEFSFDRPKWINPPVRVSSIAGIKHVLGNDEKYPVHWQHGLNKLMGANGGRRTVSATAGRRHLDDLIYKDSWKASIKAFYATMAQRLLTDKSYKLAGRTHCDVVRDVGNLVHTHFVARLFNLPLKSTDNPRGVFSEQEMYTTLSTIFMSIFFDTDPVKSFPLWHEARKQASKLAGIVETNVKITTLLGTTGLFTGKPKDDTLAAYGVNLIKGLSKTGLKAHDIAWGQILPTAGALVPNEAQLFAQAVDFYLSPRGQPHLDEIYRLAAQGSSHESDSLLLGYALEGVRMSGPPGFCREASEADAYTDEHGNETRIQAGDRVFVTFDSAVRDASYFPNAGAVDPRRPIESYVHYGAEPLTRLGTEVSKLALIELFRALFRKKGVRRVPGPQGELKKVSGPNESTVFMTEDWGAVSPFPSSMKVIWDE